jgi:Fe-S cluster biogenesis protein NfuA
MDITGMAVTAAELRETVNGDGVDLRLVGISERDRRVELELRLDDAGCADCVLPPEALLAMVQSALQRRHPGDYDVVVHDPRAGEKPATAPERSGTAVIVSPAASVAAGNDSPGREAGPLRGLTIGFRVDRLWRSWDWAADQWAQALGAAGATVVMWRRFQGLDGAEGDAHDKEFAAFLEGIDVAIVGLGNCGSCTSWTIKDAIAALEAGRPTIAVTTEHFEKLGRTLAAQYGRPALRVHVLPYPLDTRAEDDVRQIADDAFAPMLAALGASV